MSTPLKVLAVEPWYGGSHRSALDGLASKSSFRFEFVTLPARFWKWRMQGAAVPLARGTRKLVGDGFLPDLILASSMVNLPAYLALARELPLTAPVILWMHENQLTYVMPDGGEPDYTYGFLNYLSCQVADAIVFNSKYHQDVFFGALETLLGRLPDYADEASVGELRAKSTVLHLGVDGEALESAASKVETPGDSSRPLTILWNHRWEYDKNPEGFYRMVSRLDDMGCSFNLVLLGQDFGERPTVFAEALERFDDRILASGWVSSPDEYRAWLHKADVVVSTAYHEFFGIAVLEAIRCGCHPLLPDRLSYPEIVKALDLSGTPGAPILYSNEEELLATLAAMSRNEVERTPRSELRHAAAGFDWRSRAAEFDELFGRVRRAGRLVLPTDG